MAGTFIQFILDCEQQHGGALLREYMATSSLQAMKGFFDKYQYKFDDPKELDKIWDAKEKAKYISIDYEYINGLGKSY